MLSSWEVRKIGRHADLSDFWKGQIIIAKWLGQKQRNPLSNSEYLPNTVWAGKKNLIRIFALTWYVLKQVWAMAAT